MCVCTCRGLPEDTVPSMQNHPLEWGLFQGRSPSDQTPQLLAGERGQAERSQVPFQVLTWPGGVQHITPLVQTILHADLEMMATQCGPTQRACGRQGAGTPPRPSRYSKTESSRKKFSLLYTSLSTEEEGDKVGTREWQSEGPVGALPTPTYLFRSQMISGLGLPSALQVKNTVFPKVTSASWGSDVIRGLSVTMRKWRPCRS